MSASFLCFRGISKRFAAVQALEGISFDVQRGSCHALIGENGAGKSTLGKILAGVHRADSGEILLDGRVIQPVDPRTARECGISIVHQELAFCPNLTVAENLCLSDPPRRFGILDQAAMRRSALAMLGEIESDIDVNQLISQLTTGQEQLVQIAAALGGNSRILIFDEPTSSLTSVESDHLFRLIARLKARGITIIYVSHRMEEIFRLCDSITVLRDGRHVRTMPLSSTNRSHLVELMVGRKVGPIESRSLHKPLGGERLRLEDFRFGPGLGPVNLTLHAGEILGLAGLVGAGRSELAQAVFGLDPQCHGVMRVNGLEVRIKSPSDAMELGFGFLPEDRKRQGLILGMNCRENGSLAMLDRIQRGGWIDRGREQSVVREIASKLHLKAPSLESEVNQLSGGNQQKVAFAKWLARACSILIVDEPTRGVDVGAKSEIQALLDQMACEGVAILLISSEMPELMALSHRVIVIREGRVAGEMSREFLTETALLKLMSGMEDG